LSHPIVSVVNTVAIGTIAALEAMITVVTKIAKKPQLLFYKSNAISIKIVSTYYQKKCHAIYTQFS